MKDEKLLSIVMPAYNAEDQLAEGLQSLCIEEILDEIEVIVINDGSTDGTEKVANSFRDSYPSTVRVINKENGGHGSGINAGLKAAKGRYFKVVDSDDWVEKAAFLDLIKELRGTKADIVSSGFYWAYDDGSGDLNGFKKKAEIKEPFRGVEYGKIYDFDSIADRIYIKMHSMTIRTELLRRAMEEQGLMIDEDCYYVDAEYILYPIPYVKTISFIDDFVYIYRIGRTGQSISLEKMRKNEADYDKVLTSLISFYKAATGSIEDEASAEDTKSNCEPNDCEDLGALCNEMGRRPALSAKKRLYISRVIARVAAGKVKIILSYPASEPSKKRLIDFERYLKRTCPDVYYASQNKAVLLLRKTRYLLYPLASWLVRKS